MNCYKKALYFPDYLLKEKIKLNYLHPPMKIKFMFFVFFFFSSRAYSQQIGPQFSIRLNLQSDFQNEKFKDVQYPFEYKNHSATQFNWGFDFLAEKEFYKNFYGSIGVGYFKNKFNFQRAYNHLILNPGTDSVSIGTSTYNYTYNLIRFPFGISYQIKKNGDVSIRVGIEDCINFSFDQVYNGTKPFPGANNKIKKIDFFGNAILLFGLFTKSMSKNQFLKVQPYVRVVNLYANNKEILYENNSNNFLKTTDAVGVSIIFSVNF